MTTWRIGNATLSFRVPDRNMFEHIASAEWGDTPMEDLYDADAPWDTGFSPCEHRVWWWEADVCDGAPCPCGRLTLLEALERMEPALRGEAVKLHAEEMRTLYDHFWSGQAVVSGVGTTIGYACVWCLAGGPRHVWDVYESASLLAEEFGEALAAYAYELMVGEPRFHPVTGHDDGGPNSRRA